MPFFRDYLDRPDPQHMGEKALFTFAGLALLVSGTAWSIKTSVKKFEAQDLNL